MTEIARVERQPLRIPSSTGHTRLDDIEDPGVAELVYRGIPKNTIKTYKSQWVKFARWCETVGRTPYPCTRQTLASYIKYLSNSVLPNGRPPAPATLKVAMAAIVVFHRRGAEVWGDDEVQPPDQFRAYEAIKGHEEKYFVDLRLRPRVSEPLPAWAVREIAEDVDPQTAQGKRDKFLILTALKMCARRSELPSMDMGDITVIGSGLRLYLPYSKTAKYGRSDYTYIPYDRKHPELCPVAAWRAWEAALHAAGFERGPCLRPVCRHDLIGGQPNYCGRPSPDYRLTPVGFEKIYLRLIKPLRELDRPDDRRLTGRHTAHGVRSAGMSMIADATHDAVDVNDQARLSPVSAQGLRYVRRSRASGEHNPWNSVDL